MSLQPYFKDYQKLCLKIVAVYHKDDIKWQIKKSFSKQNIFKKNRTEEKTIFFPNFANKLVQGSA